MIKISFDNILGRLTRPFLMGENMKLLYKKILPYILAFEIFILSLYSCSIPVYAVDFMPRDIVQAIEYGIEYNDWQPFWIFLNNSKDGLVYLFSQMGALVTKDFQAWVNNNKALDSLAETVPVPAKKEENNIVFTKDFMAELKKLLDDYAAENQPFFVKSTHKATQIPASQFKSKTVYNEFTKYSKEHNIFVFRFNGSGFNVYDFTPVIKEGGGFYNAYGRKPESCNDIASLDGDWQTWDQKKTYYDYYEFKQNSNGDYELAEIHENSSYFTMRYNHIDITPGRTDFNPSYSSNFFLVTPDGGRIRVFKSATEFMDYSVGQRKIYYTSNYYDYVPEDLQVSIDELQKTIDDMQDVIDKLLDQIGNDTSESEIEELLRQILEALKNNPGGGGGGGGDVNVDIDLSTTNTLLSKILAKVTQISDRISETAGGAADTVHAKIQETLDEMLLQIKKLKHWTMADTMADAADAVADWLDFLKDLFSGADGAAEGVVGAISTTMDDAAQLMKTKFPFCIPWDVYLIVSFLAEEPQTPVFRLPIKLDRLGIDEYMEINLEDFEVVSSISRTLLTLLYCYALLNLTMKVFPITKEGGD